MAPGLSSGIGGFEIIQAGSGNDTITVTNATVNDGVYLIGGGGNDLLTGGLASDALQGGAGDDRLIGLAGADNFVGDVGIDTVDYSVIGRAGRAVPGFAGINGVVADLRAVWHGQLGGHAQGDTYIANDVENVIGTPNNDYIIGNVTRATCSMAWPAMTRSIGNLGNDDLVGGLGNDTLIGSDGVTFRDIDRLDGGDGNDRIYADAADLTGAPAKVVGGAGTADVLDFLFFSRAASAS